MLPYFKMKGVFPLLVATACLAATVPSARGSLPAAEHVVEELPQPEALRSARRPSSGGPSYDPYVAYDGLRRSSRDHDLYSSELDSSSRLPALSSRLRRVLQERQGTTSRLHETDEEYEPAASSHSYGSYGSDSNYGLTCTSGYVNASAVALLAFLFLLNIVQDVITQITMGRKKRDAPEDSPLEQFIGDGGLDAMYQDLPSVLLPLMVNLSDAPEPRCIQRPLCEANLHLANSYGPAGRVVGALMTNIAAKTYSGARAHHFDEAVAAAGLGRSGSCAKVPLCPRGSTKVSWAYDDEDDNVQEKETKFNDIKR